MPRIADLPPIANHTSSIPATVVGAVASASESKPSQPLWHGPSAAGSNGGVTQSMVQAYLGCRERFRIKYMLGLQPVERWQPTTGYGNMWHLCEESLAAGSNIQHDSDAWHATLDNHTREQLVEHPLQREEIEKWWHVCTVQFPEYVKFWSEHPDVLDRRPLMQEQCFDVLYELPTGRVVRLRGKYDSVDNIPSLGGVWLQEDKTKSKIDVVKLQRQLRFDLQTLTYLLTLHMTNELPADVCGVRYNVVRRDLPIVPHKAKTKKGKVYKTKPSIPDTFTPAETLQQWSQRLLNDYIAANPEEWFARIECRVSQRDVEVFRRQCLDPILENMLDDHEWWSRCMATSENVWDSELRAATFPKHSQRHFRYPFGVYNSLADGGFTDYDEYLESGVLGGLRRSDKIFSELEEASCQ